MSTLPQGTVTFLFSDVEGSTRLSRQFGDTRWAELLESHRTMLRQAFAAHSGLEVDTQGDSFFVAFTRATDAIAAALDTQLALQAHDWPTDGRVRVRIGLHTGEAAVRGNHYIGQEVHRASRICDAGHGGQIVVSQTTAELARSSLPDGSRLDDLGEHRLKDLGQPQHLFQLSAPGLATEFPRLRSLDVPTNLPVQRSSFVGRDKEIAAIRGALLEHRLVALTGIGGSGKTRLALQVGALELGNFADGVFFVDLAPVADPDLVAQTLATACGLAPGDSPVGSTRTFVDRLVMALTSRRCLLLVDNCEHLLDATAELVDQLMEGCPQVQLLATSREALGVEGEQVVQVPSLAVPEESAADAVTDAMRLFADRACAVKSSFQLDAHTAPPVAEICRRLDGIPLAIEFAAARVAHLSVQQIAERLEDRFHLLTGGRRRIQRQQTLSATLDWSHDLLGEQERIVFRRLAVFAGSFALDAAETVCSGKGMARDEVLDLLGSLAAKSLVTVGQGERGQTRYRLLETVRLYALDKLDAAGEVHGLRSKHRDHYLAWLEAMPLESLFFGLKAIESVGREIDNLRAAADWCLADDRPDLLARLVTRIRGFWSTGNSYRIAKGLLEQALTQEERLSTEERVDSHTLLAWLSIAALDLPAALNHALRAVDLAAGLVAPSLAQPELVRAFGNAILASIPGTDPNLSALARSDVELAIKTARAGLPKAWQANAEYWFAAVEMNLGDNDAAARWYSACVQTWEGAKLEEGWLLPTALSGLAGSLHLLGRTDDALDATQRFLALRERSSAQWLWFDGQAVEVVPALFAGGHQELADRELNKAAVAMRRNGVDLAPNQFLSLAAVVEFLRGRPERAARLLGAARCVGGADKEIVAFRTPTSLAFYTQYMSLVRAVLGADQARRARDEGRAMTLNEAFSYALQGLEPLSAAVT